MEEVEVYQEFFEDAVGWIKATSPLIQFTIEAHALCLLHKDKNQQDKWDTSYTKLDVIIVDGDDNKLPEADTVLRKQMFNIGRNLAKEYSKQVCVVMIPFLLDDMQPCVMIGSLDKFSNFRLAYVDLNQCEIHRWKRSVDGDTPLYLVCSMWAIGFNSYNADVEESVRTN